MATQYLDLQGLQYYNGKIQAQLSDKVDKEDGKGLSSNDLTDELLAKLENIEDGANAYEHPTGDGNLHVPATGTTNEGKVLTAGATAGELIWKDATAVGVDAYTKTESDAKYVAQETGKGLSTNDFTDELLTKLDGIEDGATNTVVDDALSDTSENPVQNKVVKTAIDAINTDIESLEGDSHTHDNQTILDATTASFTTEQETKLAAFGDASTYALKSDIVGIYKYKGSVADEASLPDSDNTVGDVYNVEDTGMNYAWTEGGTWDALGMTLTIDTISNSDIDAMF